MPTTNYVWDPVIDAYPLETDGAGTTQATYTVEPTHFGRVVSQRRSSLTNYMHQDALGSTRQLTGFAKTTTDSWTYDSWGNEKAHSGSSVLSLTWGGEIGYLVDPESTSFDLRRRRYLPGIGRFSSSDPIAFASGEINLYAYARSQPASWSDPSGLCANCSYLKHPGSWPPLTIVTTDCDECYSKVYRKAGMVTNCVSCDHPRPQPDPPVPADGFYLALDIADTDKGRRCRCQHTDIVRVHDGAGREIRVGFGGGSRASQGRRNPRKGDVLLVRCSDPIRRLQFGSGARCSDATDAEIEECVTIRPKPTSDYNIAFNNCQTDVADTLEDCCLCGTLVGPGALIRDFLIQSSGNQLMQ